MILDNSGIDYSRMLLFVLDFLVYWKIERILEPLTTPGLRLYYKPVTSKLSKNKMSRHRQQFLMFYYNK